MTGPDVSVDVKCRASLAILGLASKPIDGPLDEEAAKNAIHARGGAEMLARARAGRWD